MNPKLAILAYALGIAGLFYLNRDKSVRTSKALWIPVIYLWVLGSRPVSFWLGVPQPDVGAITADGSPIDGVFFGILLFGALGVLAQRGKKVLNVLGASGPILLYFAFCLLSAVWSDFHDVAAKRWFKAVGDLAMVLIVLTDRDPRAALSRLYSRTAFVLAPLSLLCIKYFPNLGRSYDPWTGRQMLTGLTGDKNALGVITFVLLVGALWQVLALLPKQNAERSRKRKLIAQGIVLAIGVFDLILANSVTSLVSFALAAVLLVAMNHRLMRRHPAAVHVLVLLIATAVGFVFLAGGKASAAHALGRDSSFSGRTEIWQNVIPLAPNALIGAGFESFWLNPAVHEKLWAAMPGLPLNEAHDGYIEVYLELGLMGIALIGYMLFEGYRRSMRAYRRDPKLGALLVAYVVSAAMYSLTEAGFRMMNPIWLFLLLSVSASGSILSGVVARAPKPQQPNADRVSNLPAKEWVLPEKA
jgi:O-antigen ligase